MNFKIWFENREARLDSNRDIILSYLKDKMGITDDSSILDLNTKDLDPEIINDLISRGIIKTSDPMILDRIKNGIVIQDLINLLSVGDGH